MIRTAGLAGPAALAVLFLAAWTPTARADFTEEVKRCDFGGGHPDIRIVACTRNIKSGRFTGSNLAVAFSNRALAYKKKGQWDNAINDYDEAIRLKPDFAEALSNRGNVYRKKGLIERAIEDYDKAIGLNPDDARVFAERGLAYEKKGEHSQALRDYRMAFKLGFFHPLLLRKLNASGGLP